MKKDKSPILELGCGLIRLGRRWGVADKPSLSQAEAQEFLEKAFTLGIRFFDTAPAYGLSEERLGFFLRHLTDEQKKEITIATKFGEHWDENTQDTFVDHSYEKLQRSIEESMRVLGKIDVLEIHKTSQQVLEAVDTAKIFVYAREMGIDCFGASISDSETGLLACLDERLSYIQLPYNEQRTDLLPVIDKAKVLGKKIIFNRPFAMGALVQNVGAKQKHNKIIQAYQFIKKCNCSGIVLTGTASVQHLRENIACFSAS